MNPYMGQIDNGISTVKITNLTFIPTKQYQDVHRRPYELNINSGVLATLENTIGDQLSRGTSVNPIAIANVAPDMMKISDVPKEKIFIKNGWGTTRLRFIMEVESNLSGSIFISYIQGYTDYSDQSLTGRIDPNMPININSITNVIRNYIPATNNYDARVHSSYNILYDPYSASFTVENNNTHRLLRPVDISDGMEITDTGLGASAIVDTRTLYGVLPKESKRNNNIGVQHVSSVINSYLLGKDMASIGYAQEDTLGVFSSDLNEDNLSTVPFIEALSSQTGDIKTVTFTLNDLIAIDPGVSNVLTLIDNSTQLVNTNFNNIMDTNDTATLNTVSIESSLATTVSESVSSLLAEEMLSVIDFSITNQTVNSEYVETISNVRSYMQGIDPTIYVRRFINKFKALVMPNITKNNLLAVTLYVSADILGDTTVAISVNGAPQVVYRLPTFCNSLYTSMVSDNSSYNILVDDMSQVLQMTKGLG